VKLEVRGPAAVSQLGLALSTAGGEDDGERGYSRIQRDKSHVEGGVTVREVTLEYQSWGEQAKQYALVLTLATELRKDIVPIRLEGLDMY
jgi:hypothetical protein